MEWKQQGQHHASAPPSSVIAPAQADQGFPLGERVQYWSDVEMTWLVTHVENKYFKDHTLVYELGCQKGFTVPADYVREDRHFVYEVGEIVEYWSASARRWVQAKVQSLGDPGKVNLDVKVGAHTSRLRKNLASHVAYNGPSGDPKAPRGAPGHQQSAPPPPLSRSFKVGDQVQYWSETTNKWIEAVVQVIKEKDDSIIYDLDVKKGSPADRVRPSLVGTQERFQVGEEVEYWSQTVGRWLMSKVQRTNPDSGTVDLDCKIAAPLGRLRRPIRLQSDTPRAEAVHHGMAPTPVPFHRPALAPPPAPEKPKPSEEYNPFDTPKGWKPKASGAPPPVSQPPPAAAEEEEAPARSRRRDRRDGSRKRRRGDGEERTRRRDKAAAEQEKGDPVPPPPVATAPVDATLPPPPPPATQAWNSGVPTLPSSQAPGPAEEPEPEEEEAPARSRRRRDRGEDGDNDRNRDRKRHKDKDRDRDRDRDRKRRKEQQALEGGAEAAQPQPSQPPPPPQHPPPQQAEEDEPRRRRRLYVEDRHVPPPEEQQREQEEQEAKNFLEESRRRREEIMAKKNQASGQPSPSQPLPPWRSGAAAPAPAAAAEAAPGAAPPRVILGATPKAAARAAAQERAKAGANDDNARQSARGAVESAVRFNNVNAESANHHSDRLGRNGADTISK